MDTKAMHSWYETSRNTRDIRTEALKGNNYLDRPVANSGIHMCGELLEEVKERSNVDHVLFTSRQMK